MSQIEDAERELREKLQEDDSGGEESEEEDETDELVKEIVKDAEKKNKSKSKRLESKNSKILYIGHLPKNFEEAEIAGFLKQFGAIANLKVARSTKTGGSRGYAFVKMKSPDVAAIVADTLSGYIVMGTKRLVCHLVPKDKVHPGLFAKSHDLSPKALRGKKKPPQSKSLGKLKQITSKLIKREQKKRRALKEMGIDYDFPGYEGSMEKVKEVEQGENDKNSVENDKKKKKDRKRKDSIGSVDSNASSKRKKARKNSASSVDSTSKKKTRKESTDDSEHLSTHMPSLKKRRNSKEKNESEEPNTSKSRKKRMR